MHTKCWWLLVWILKKLSDLQRVIVSVILGQTEKAAQVIMMVETWPNFKAWSA